MILRFKVPVIHRYLACSAKDLIIQTLKVSILWKDRPYTFATQNSLVQAFKILPFVVSKVAKI